MSQHPPNHPYQPEPDDKSYNKRIGNMNVHMPIFPLSFAFILLFVVSGILAPAWTGAVLEGCKNWIITHMDWLVMGVMNLCVVLCVAIALLPIGKIRLGGRDAKPEFSTLAWFCMLFAAGMGVGLVFWGVGEPVAYYTQWYESPFNVAPRTPEAEKLAMAASLFHWGLHPWAIYLVVGLMVGYFAYNKNLPASVSSALAPLIGYRKMRGFSGQIIEVFAVIMTTFGLATSLGLGSLQSMAGMNHVLGLPNTFGMQLLFIVAVTALASLSVSLGMNAGVKMLSNINLALATALLAFVIVASGLGAFIGHFFRNLWAYAANLPALSNWVGRPDQAWLQGWTVYYWVWWAAWAPLAGVFIAKISKGRTLRQMVLVSMVMPMLFGALWMTAFGNGAIQQIAAGQGALVQGISSIDLSIFQYLASFPLSALTAIVVVVLLVIFMVTSVDSGALVVDTLAAGGDENTSRLQKVMWVVMIGLIAIALLYVGGDKALKAIQAGTIAMGFPFMIILLVLVAGFIKALIQDYRNKAHR